MTNEVKHTPGPWMQDEDRPFDILFDDRAGENEHADRAIAKAEGCVMRVHIEPADLAEAEYDDLHPHPLSAIAESRSERGMTCTE